MGECFRRVNKTELAELLGIHSKSISRLTLEKIEEKLLKNCYVLHKVEKVGREMIYTIEYQEQNFNINDYVESEFNIKNTGKFMEHTNERVKSIKEDIPMSAESIGRKIDIPKNTCVDWDNKLEKKGVISKMNEEFLYYFKYPTGECMPVSKEEYDNYCKVNRVILLEMKDLYSRLEKHKITKGYFETNYDALKEKLKDGVKAYKLYKYELDESNPCYQIMKEYLGL